MLCIYFKLTDDESKSVLPPLILTGLLLVVTIGVPIYRHTCYVFDRSEVSLLTQKQCCAPSESSSQAAIDFKCCSLEHIDTALEYETLVKDSESVVTIATLPPHSGSDNMVIVSEKSEPMPVLRPPPLANRDLLTKIQVFLI